MEYQVMTLPGPNWHDRRVIEMATRMGRASVDIDLAEIEASIPGRRAAFVSRHEEYEMLLACYLSGQMSQKQFEQHKADDPAFAAYANHFRRQS